MKTYQPTEENLAKCKELLLDPKYHALRVRIIEQNVASARKSRCVFRAPQTVILNCLLDYATEHYSGYKAFMDEVKNEFKAVAEKTKANTTDPLQHMRKRTSDAVQRARYRKTQTARPQSPSTRAYGAYVFLKSGKPKPPTWAEVKDEIKRLQEEWADEAEYEMISDPSAGLSTSRRREIYDQITARLEAEVKRLKQERYEQRKRDLEREDS